MPLQDCKIIGACAAPSERANDDECGRAATCTVGTQDGTLRGTPREMGAAPDM